MSRRRGGRPSRLGTLLLLVGCATLLGGAFVGGVTAGRHWPRLLPMFGSTVVRRAADTPRGREPRGGDKPRPAEPAPVLTFYQELTAPLTAPPPAKPKAERPAPAAKAEPPQPGPNTTPGHYEPLITDPGPAPSPPAPADGPGVKSYTVQVGAFGERGQAEALTARLKAAGFDAYAAEIDGPATLRYRVRVGAFASRDDARRTAQRLAERKLATYVTTR